MDPFVGSSQGSGWRFGGVLKSYAGSVQAGIKTHDRVSMRQFLDHRTHNPTKCRPHKRRRSHKSKHVIVHNLCDKVEHHVMNAVWTMSKSFGRHEVQCWAVSQIRYLVGQGT